MKVTSEEFTKLVGPNGEMFTSEGEYREPKKGEFYLTEESQVFLCPHDNWTPSHIVLTRAKTARDWLSELPDGWREEALASLLVDDSCVDLGQAVCQIPWADTPSGVRGWSVVEIAVRNGTAIPPHPSKAKPKIERLPVQKQTSWLWAGDTRLDGWLGHSDFRGFVFVLPNGDEVPGLSTTVIWRAADRGLWSHSRTEYYNIPLRPSFVEVEQ